MTDNRLAMLRQRQIITRQNLAQEQADLAEAKVAIAYTLGLLLDIGRAILELERQEP